MKESTVKAAEIARDITVKALENKTFFPTTYLASEPEVKHIAELIGLIYTELFNSVLKNLQA